MLDEIPRDAADTACEIEVLFIHASVELFLGWWPRKRQG